METVKLTVASQRIFTQVSEKGNSLSTKNIGLQLSKCHTSYRGNTEHVHKREGQNNCWYKMKQ